MDDIKASSLNEGLLIPFQRDLRFAVRGPRKPWIPAAASLILTAAVYLHPTTLPISLSSTLSISPEGLVLFLVVTQ
mgnify:CR=1 FL=1